MNIYEKILNALTPLTQNNFTTHEIKKIVHEKYGTNWSSVIPSDFCYNRINQGIKFDKFLFIRLSRGNYHFVGENYPYNGFVYKKPSGDTIESVAGEWRDGVFTPV
jgi:hypothetical protein